MSDQAFWNSFDHVSIRQSTEALAMTDSYAQLDARFTKDRSRMRSREVAYESIKNAILGGLLEPQERLIEERLGEALQISRTPVREALAILEHEGLLESIPYKGLVVRAITLDEFSHMYEALGVIESALARSAAANASTADIQQMETSLEAAAAAIPTDVLGYLTACREFQAVLGTCASSPFLARMLLSIEERSDMYLLHTRQPLSPEKMHASVNDRRIILDAIRTGDPEMAAQAALAHAASIRVRWRELYPDHSRP
jgi:DNA-binding GntR family transcriptional regulator